MIQPNIGGTSANQVNLFAFGLHDIWVDIIDAIDIIDKNRYYMAENRTMDSIHKGVLKKFHTLCSVLGLSEDEKRAIVESYGVESSRDMDTHDLINVCAHLSEQANKKNGSGEVDKLRKRVMASIGSYLQSVGKSSNASIIKGIACRATGYKEFNKIPRERLRNLIATFNNKVKDGEGVKEVLTTMMLQSIMKRDSTQRYEA